MASRRQQQEAARARREELERQRQRAASRGRRVRLVLGGLASAAVLTGVVGLALTAGGGGGGGRVAQASIPEQRTTDLKAAAKLAGATFTSYRYGYGTGNHVTTPVNYPMNPPTNGPHFPVPAADGNYVGRASPPTEQVVHSLEHGRIEIQYRPGLPRARIDQLVALYEEDPQHVLLFENETGMDCDVAVTAWAHGMLCKSFTPAVFDAVRAFRDQYRDHGPEYVA